MPDVMVLGALMGALGLVWLLLRWCGREIEAERE